MRVALSRTSPPNTRPDGGIASQLRILLKEVYDEARRAAEERSRGYEPKGEKTEG